MAAPAGFLPSAIRAGAAVPVCAPGYSLLIAPLVAVLGPDAVHLVPPVAAGVLVWLCVRARAPPGVAGGRRGGGRTHGRHAHRALPGGAADERHRDRRAVARGGGGDVRGPARAHRCAGRLALLVRPNLAIAGAAAVAGTAWLRANAPQPGWPRRALGVLVVSTLAPYRASSRRWRSTGRCTDRRFNRGTATSVCCSRPHTCR